MYVLLLLLLLFWGVSPEDCASLRGHLDCGNWQSERCDSGSGFQIVFSLDFEGLVVVCTLIIALSD